MPFPLQPFKSQNYRNRNEIQTKHSKSQEHRDYWNVILNWLERLSKINLKNIPIFIECILFGYPNPSPKTKDKIHVINYCIFYIKYYIYIQKLFNKNHLDVHSCKMQLKQKKQNTRYVIKTKHQLSLKSLILYTITFEYYI